MTIFLEVLKKTLNERLHKVAADQHTKSESYGYNHDLSTAQHGILTKLIEDIFGCKDKANEKASLDAVKDLLDKAINDIQDARVENKEPRTGGNTLSKLNELRASANEFYTKMVDFSGKFNLLKRPYNENSPEDIVCYHAAYYLGQEIFKPSPTMNAEIRASKENLLAVRLKKFNTLRPGLELSEQIEWTLDLLKDLASDNKGAIKKRSKGGLPIPGISFAGFSLSAPMKLFDPKPGRLDERIKAAKDQVLKLKHSLVKPGSKSGKDSDHEDEDREVAGDGPQDADSPVLGAVRTRAKPKDRRQMTPSPEPRLRLDDEDSDSSVQTAATKQKSKQSKRQLSSSPTPSELEPVLVSDHDEDIPQRMSSALSSEVTAKPKVKQKGQKLDASDAEPDRERSEPSSPVLAAQTQSKAKPSKKSPSHAAESDDDEPSALELAVSDKGQKAKSPHTSLALLSKSKSKQKGAGQKEPEKEVENGATVSATV